MTLKKVYEVNEVSKDNIRFDVRERKNLYGIYLNEIKNAISEGKLKREPFEKISQQGFNIIQIEKEDYEQVLKLDADLSLTKLNNSESDIEISVNEIHNTNDRKLENDNKIVKLEQNEIESGYDEISKRLWIDKEKVIEIVVAIESG